MRSSALVIVILLAACADRPALDTGGPTPAVATSPPQTPSADSPRDREAARPDGAAPAAETMPADGCTLEGYWSFFETFVREPQLRTAFSDERGRASLASFDVAQHDSRWVRASDAAVALDIKETRQASTFEVEATPVQLDAEDDIIRALGETERYRFEFKDGCWRFAGTP